MKRVFHWVLILGAVVFLGAFFVMPPLARRGGIYRGSREYALRWAEQLKGCDSLDDVKRRFKCIRIDWTTESSYEQVQLSDVKKRTPYALVHSWTDANWIACAYADSHGDPAGGTLVARDSQGTVRIFFGHICGKPIFARGDTIEAVYEALADSLTEVSLEGEPAAGRDAPVATN